jgi:hypothetical protein
VRVHHKLTSPFTTRAAEIPLEEIEIESMAATARRMEDGRADSPTELGLAA